MPEVHAQAFSRPIDMPQPKIYYLSNKNGWSSSLHGVLTYPITFSVSNVSHTGNGSFSFSWGDTLDVPVAVERSSSLSGPWSVVSSNNFNGSFTDFSEKSDSEFYRAYLFFPKSASGINP